MDDSNGWIKLYRQSLDNPLFKLPNTWHFWQYCLLRANHKDCEVIFDGKPVLLKAGQFIASLNTSSANTGLSVQCIRSAIKTLVICKMIEISTQQLTHRASVVTVCKYCDFQDKNFVANTVINTVSTQSQHSLNTVSTLDKNVKNVKNNKYSSSKEFDIVWEKVPKRNDRKQGKKSASVLFEKLSLEDKRKVYLGLVNYNKHVESTGQIAMDLSRFIRNRYFEDYLENQTDKAKRGLVL